MTSVDDDAANVIHRDDMSDETAINSKEEAKNCLKKAIALNDPEKFNQEALEWSSKAVEYDPRLVDAWIELAECKRRKPDMDGAIEALEKALVFSNSEDKINQIILRKLSAYVRQQTFDKQELKMAAVLRSVDLAKQALKADLNDGENYYNLAKAYMCLFFVTECVDHQLINLSKTAYQKAFTLSEKATYGTEVLANKDISVCRQSSTKSLLEQSDFLFNYSTVLLYCQEFEKSLEHLRVASKLDLDWIEPKNVEECIVDYVRQTHSMFDELNKNSKKNVKRYTKVIEPLKNVDRIETIIHLDQQRIMKSSDVKVKQCFIEDLHRRNSVDYINESNTVELLHLKLINMVNCNQAMYITFMAMDKNYTPIVVTIYSLAAPTCPGPRDVLTIVNPKLDTISVGNINRNNNQSITYNRINVREFRDFYVNGFWIKNDQVAKPQFSVSILP